MGSIELGSNGFNDIQITKDLKESSTSRKSRVAAFVLQIFSKKAGAIKSLIHFLRWDQHWEKIDDLKIPQNLGTLAARVCVLIWPDINEMLRFKHCDADDILGTRVEPRRRRKYGNLIRPRSSTPLASGAVAPPPVPPLDRPSTVHKLITEEDAALAVAPIHDIVNESPNQQHPILLAWLRHVDTQPEIYAFMEKTLRERRSDNFSAISLLEYGRWSIWRAAEIHKRFKLNDKFDGLYCRALIRLNPQFNGQCEFRSDSVGKSRSCIANGLLGYSLEPEPINGEPYRRLIWNMETK